jgi:2,3-bisphosphoglycerate-independent phosphoglycerate mutase
MNGEAPVAIPTTFENTKFPSVAERIRNLVTSREEALAAHELARSRMAERIKSNFVLFKKGQMAWLDLRHLKTNYHKKMAVKASAKTLSSYFVVFTYIAYNLAQS